MAYFRSQTSFLQGVVPPLGGADYMQNVQGFGKVVTGGATNELVVTNLLDSGVGSLRAILEGNIDDAVIRFDDSLSGDIVLATPITINGNTDVTWIGKQAVRVTGEPIKFDNFSNILVANVNFGQSNDDSLTFRAQSAAADPLRPHTFCVVNCEFEGPNVDAALDVIWSFGKEIHGTIAYCVFNKHDKTLLIDSSSATNDPVGKFYHVTLHNNHFWDNKQRQPLHKNGYCHVFNSYYDGYGDDGGSGVGVNTRGGGEGLTQYNVVRRRDVGEIYGYTGATVTNPAGNWSRASDVTGALKHEGNVLLNGASETEQDPGLVFDPATYYTHTVNTSPDAAQIISEAGCVE